MNLLIFIGVCTTAAVCGADSVDQKIEYYLDTFLDLYYDKYLKPEGGGDNAAETLRDEGMQSDQPADDNTINPRFNNISYYTTVYEHNLEAIRKREKDGEEDRDKHNRLKHLKEEILRQLDRNNSNFLPQGGNLNASINISQQVMHHINRIRNQSIDYYITEKIRTFYPSCDLPKDHEVKKDENTMALFVDVDQLKGNLSTATLRLYRGNTTLSDGDVDKENQYKVTVYFLTKDTKPRRNKVKKEMCDSKVVKENQHMTELNVAPAVRAWSEAKNLGFIVQVEDQYDRVIRADSFFNGCIFGSSTPKPIPSILFDASFQPPTIPTIDICMLEIPENYTGSYKAHGCSLLGLSVHPLPPPLPVAHQQSVRHIRHQRQHQRDTEDPRSRIVQRKVIMTNEELQSLNATESGSSS